MDAGIVQEAKRRKFYLKPSLRKSFAKSSTEEAAGLNYSNANHESLYMLRADIKSTAKDKSAITSVLEEISQSPIEVSLRLW